MSTAAVDKMLAWRRAPVDFVMEVFGPGFEAETGEPLVLDDWQEEGLRYLAPHAPHDWCDGSPAQGIGIRAAKGPGKSAEDAWIIWWLKACWPYPNIAAMSITGDNLRDGLKKELAVWYSRAPLLKAAFEIQGERIVPKNVPRDIQDRWFCSFRSFPKNPDKEQQSASVAGMHSENVAVVIDEAGDVPPGVLAAAEGIHANKVHSLVVLTGNCTSMDGALYDATVKRAHRYHVVKITGDPDDPKRSRRMDKDYCRKLIEDYGRNDPVVMINVLGEFPPTGIAKLLGPADIEKAVARQIPIQAYEQEVKVAALDIARQGLDSSVYTLRQGSVHFEQRVWRIPDLMLLADQVAMRLVEDEPAALIVLATGIGWGVVDRLNQMGYGELIIAIDEGTDALDAMFANRRAEMWWHGSEWVKRRGHLLKDPELHADLTAMGYRHRFIKGATRLLLDPSEEVRARLGRSPDKGTSFVGTFAAPVAPKGLRMAKHSQHLVETEFDPIKHLLGGN